MKYVISILLTLGLIVGSTPEVYPCSPVTQSHRRDYREAKAIFIGKAVSVDFASDVPKNLKGEVDYKVTFSVERRWKGANNSTISILAYYGPAACRGFEFHEGERYLVYAFGDELIVSTMFSRSRPINHENEQTQKEMRQLNSFWWRSLSHIPFLK